MDEQFEIWLEAYSELQGQEFNLDEQDRLYDAFRAGWEYRRLLER